MKLELSPDTVITVGATLYTLSDLVRKNYRVEVSRDSALWEDDQDTTVFDNSTEANARAEQHRASGLEARIVVCDVTDRPKKAFWDLRKTKAGKAALTAAGVFVQKRDNGEYYVTAKKASKTFWKTYRSFDYMYGDELDCYDAALKDAIRDGDGAGSETEKENLRDLRENFGLAPSPKYAAAR